jgi:hypothetical protein
MAVIKERKLIFEEQIQKLLEDKEVNEDMSWRNPNVRILLSALTCAFIHLGCG